MPTHPPPTNPQKVYLKPNIQVEPLVGRWYAGSLLVPPASAALNLEGRYLPIMKSYASSPQIHQAALKNPAMRGGPFIDLDGQRTGEVKDLIRQTSEEFAGPLEFARALKSFSARLAGAGQSSARPAGGTQEEAEGNPCEGAGGMSLEQFYRELPPTLQGYVELAYDLNHSPTVRVLESLLYRSPYYVESAQGIALSEIRGDGGRPFIMSTPRLADPQTAFLKTPFRDPALDALFRMKREPAPLAEIRERLQVGGDEAPAQLFDSFFTDTPPAPATRYEGAAPRIRYLGHAGLLIETGAVRILVDPFLSYTYPNQLPRYTYDDLPDAIDYVLITHSHHDHIFFETLLQLRHRVKAIVVGRNYDGAPQDPSLQLALRQTGFPDVLEVRDMDRIPVPGGSITAIPFLGEHHDLLIQSKNGYLIQLGERRVLCMADSCNPESQLFDHVFRETGVPDTLFLGMECEGAPLSWLYGVFFPRPLPRALDQSRRSRGSNFAEASALVDRFGFQQVYVYAMGQEPWLAHILDNELDASSQSHIQSRQLVAHCQAKGIPSEILYGQKEL